MRGKRDRSPSDWNDLIDLLRRVRDGAGMTLREAQQLFASAPDDPLSSRELRNLVAVAISRLDKGRAKSWGELVAGLLRTADTTVVLQLDAFDPPDLVGLHSCSPLPEPPDMDSFSVDSLSVDAEHIRMAQLSREMRISRASADPVVLDVWADFQEPAGQPLRMIGEGTIRWNACLDAYGWEVGHCGVSQCAVSCPPWFESADYDDDVIEEIRRN